MITYQIGTPQNIVSENDFGQIEALLHELAPDSKINIKDVRRALIGYGEQPMTYLVLARDREKIVGMGTQIFVQNWFGRHSFLHDMVIEKKYRGKEYGIFAKIAEMFAENDKKMGSKFCDLTCGIGRVAAHKAYKKHGFEKRDSLVLRREVKNA
jgi:hypothetical protein